MVRASSVDSRHGHLVPFGRTVRWGSSSIPDAGSGAPSRMRCGLIQEVAVRRLCSRRQETVVGRLDDKIALITAAGAGIGRATSEAFIQEGARVFATDIDAARIGDLACEVRQLDVRSTGAVQ